MLNDILITIKGISVPASMVVILLILERAGVLRLFVDLLRSKINGSTDPTTREAIDNIAENHLHEIKDLLIDVRNLLYSKFDVLNKSVSDLDKSVSNQILEIRNDIIKLNK